MQLRPKNLEVLRATVRRFPTVREVKVFGSRATDTARRASDLDLAVSAPEATPAEWSAICDALENAPLIYQLDVVRSERMTNPHLQAKIAAEGVVI